MMNSKSHYILCVCWAALLTAITVCGCISASGESETPTIDTTAAESARIEAPKPVEETEHVRISAVTEAAETEAETYSTTDALEIMSGLPLRAEVQLEIEQMCADRNIVPAVVVAMIYHESRYDEKAVGDACNSYGLMQIQPRWHSGRMDKLGVKDLLDGVQNVKVGIDYLDELLHIYGGDYGKALTAYNAGHYKGEITNYAKSVMAKAEELEGTTYVLY